MPKIGDIYPSKFLKESDLAQPILLTIAKVTIEELGKGSEKDLKPVLHFQEIEKSLSINQTNAKNIAKITGSDNTDDWAGKKIVVYWNPDIEFGGETVGGVRVRAMKSQQPPKEDPPF